MEGQATTPPRNGVAQVYRPQGLTKKLLSTDSRSEEVTEIIGKMPPWIIRRGIVLVGVILVGILVGAYFFKYPDVISSKITISSGNPAVKLVARNSLPIQQLLVGNNDSVESGQPLCVLANSALYNDIRQLAPAIRQLDTMTDLFSRAAEITIPAGLQLGDLQPAYTDLCLAWQNYRFFIAHNAYRSSIGHLTRQVQYNEELQGELHSKERMLQEQLKLEHHRFAADSSLVTERIISPLEYEQSKRKMLDQQMNTGTNRSAIIENSLQQIAYQKDIAGLTLQKQTDENGLQQKIREALRRYDGQYAQWEQNFLLKSPTKGRVSFFKYWKQDQFVTAGEGVMMVIPPMQQYVVRGTIGRDKAGKIKAGQTVLIKLPAYPYEEYGMLRGRILDRSVVAMDGNFSLEVRLEKGLVTNTGRVIPPQPEFEAEGEILTENKSILERLFERLVGRWRG